MKRGFLVQITGATQQLSIYLLAIHSAHKHGQGSEKSCT